MPTRVSLQRFFNQQQLGSASSGPSWPVVALSVVQLLGFIVTDCTGLAYRRLVELISRLRELIDSLFRLLAMLAVLLLAGGLVWVAVWMTRGLPPDFILWLLTHPMAVVG